MTLCARRRVPRWTSIALVLAVSVAASSQEPRRLTQPDSIHIELASALMAAGGFPAEPEILVGAFPGWMTARIPVSAGARVLGSAFLGTTAVGVVTVPQEPAAAIAQMKLEFEKLGWAPPPLWPMYGGGFRDPPPVMMGNVPVVPGLTSLTLCGGDQQMLIVRASRERTGTNVIYRITPASTASTCKPPEPSPANLTVRSLLPTLYNPTLAREYEAMRTCQLEGYSSTVTQLATQMSAQEILDHYAKQMQDSGWQPASTSIGWVWSKPDSTGAPQRASLVVGTSARDSMCHDVALLVWGTRRR